MPDPLLATTEIERSTPLGEISFSRHTAPGTQRGWEGGALFIIGGPGVGKGTHSMILAERLGIPHISTGELLRRRASVDDPKGRRIAKLINKRLLVPNHYVCELLADELERLGGPKSFILDGSPRSSRQATALQNFLPSCGIHRTHALYLEADDSTLIDRQTRRAAEALAAGAPLRGDEQSIEEGIAVFHRVTTPMLARFRRLGILSTVHVDSDSVAENAELIAITLGLPPLLQR